MQVKCPKADECKTEFCVHVKLHEYESCNCSATKDCPICVPCTSTLITKPEYELIKPVSIKALEEVGMPKPMLWHFAYLVMQDYHTFGYEMRITEILVHASQVHQCLDWLRSHGFIKIKNPELKVGSIVNVIDGSYSYGIKDNKLTDHIPIGQGIDNPMEVIEICEGLPTYLDGRETDLPQSNNLILRGKSGKIYFSHKRFVRLVQP